MVDIDWLRENLNYNPDTGRFSWKKPGTGRRADRIGSYNGGGYLQLHVRGRRPLMHKVAWAMHYGEWPSGLIDHINGVRDDNRIVNLRVVDATGNTRNAAMQRNNTSGVRGVGWHKSEAKWRAYIGDSGRLQHLGHHADWFDAVCARKSAENRLGYHPNHGRAA